MNIALNIAYVGTNYSGWQKQKNCSSICEVIENAFKEKFGESIELIGSGRTDAGVHAICQTANFQTNINVAPEKIAFALNAVLPNDIRILKSFQVENSFHSRFDAKEKTYVYSTYVSKIENVFYYQRKYQIENELDIKNIKEVANVLIGEHDFTSFCKTASSDKPCIRTIYSINVITNGNNIDFEICGNGFLHNMVRIIVGTLIDAGRNKINSDDVKEILKSKNRTFASRTLPPYALYLKEVKYWQY